MVILKSMSLVLYTLKCVKHTAGSFLLSFLILLYKKAASTTAAAYLVNNSFFASLIIRIYALSSHSLNSNVPVTATITNDIIRTPQKQMITPTTRPQYDLGYISPYPQLVSVITMFHMQLLKLVKSCPETSERGDSRILSIYPNMIIDNPKLHKQIV